MKPVSLFGLTVLLTMIGCSEERPDGIPPLHSVTLQFHQEGVPLGEASIRLIPQFDSNWAVGGEYQRKR